jgi:hypothetical protein
MFFEMLMLILSISLCLFEAVKLDSYYTPKFIARSNLVGCVINEIFSFSLLGEVIQHESQMISEMIYNSNWYNFNFHKRSSVKACCSNAAASSKAQYPCKANSKAVKEFKALINMTMIRAKRNVQISAGGFFIMNFETYLNVSAVIVCSEDSNIRLIFTGDEVLLHRRDHLNSDEKCSLSVQFQRTKSTGMISLKYDTSLLLTCWIHCCHKLKTMTSKGVQSFRRIQSSVC